MQTTESREALPGDTTTIAQGGVSNLETYIANHFESFDPFEAHTATLASDSHGKEMNTAFRLATAKIQAMGQRDHWALPGTASHGSAAPGAEQQQYPLMQRPLSSALKQGESAITGLFTFAWRAAVRRKGTSCTDDDDWTPSTSRSMARTPGDGCGATQETVSEEVADSAEAEPAAGPMADARERPPDDDLLLRMEDIKCLIPLCTHIT